MRKKSKRPQTVRRSKSVLSLPENPIKLFVFLSVMMLVLTLIWAGYRVWKLKPGEIDMSSIPAMPGYTYLKSDVPGVEFVEATKFDNEDVYRLFIRADGLEHSPENDKKRPSQTKDIIWESYNYVSFIDPSIMYTYRFPETGSYCEGCFDGWPGNNMQTNVEGQWISGGYFDMTSERLWSLTSGIIFKEAQDSPTFATYSEEDFKASTDTKLYPMFSKMLATPVGGTVQITDAHGQGTPYTATRLANIKNGVYSFALFKTTDENAQSYAILDKGHHLIVFSYTYSDSVYNVFDTILKSYSEQINPDARYGQLAPVKSIEGLEVVN